MTSLHRLYRDSLSLLTDLYQLTMAYAYWKAGLVEREAAFHLFFRKNPFGGGFAVASGLGPAIDFLHDFQFDEKDLAYLKTLKGNDGGPLFDREFLDYLGNLRLECTIEAVPEGTVVFPHEPLVRVEGPILHCQLLETPLLTLINFPTLIATKAARVCLQAPDDTVIEFGLRRAQGIDGGASAARAAYVGGCVGTSNVLAGKLFDIPVLGTHAHSWVMCFETELEAFRAYARAMPNNCVFLVDTYDSLQGTRNAVEVSRWLREQGHEPVGIRLDSGDLAELSIEARTILDDGGFPDAKIVGSSDLDEYAIRELKRRGAKIEIWGVGTRLATAWDDPALGGVYKLSAVRDPGQKWQHRIKTSDDPLKATNPGLHQVRRYTQGDTFLRDVIYNIQEPPKAGCTVVAYDDPDRKETVSDETPFTDLLVPVLRGGRAVYEPPQLQEARQRTLNQLAALPEGVKRLEDPEEYAVGLEERLSDLKQELIRQVQEQLP